MEALTDGGTHRWRHPQMEALTEDWKKHSFMEEALLIEAKHSYYNNR